MSRKGRIIISITGIVLVSLILIGLTYGFFATRIKGNNNDNSISVTTADLKLEYGESDGYIIGQDEVIEPGKVFDAKTFTVTNKGSGTINYNVIIENVVITDLDTNTSSTDDKNVKFESNDFVYTLTCTSGCNGVSTETEFPMSGGILVTNSIEEGVTQTYSFQLTYKYLEDIDQSDDMNKSLSARINISVPNSIEETNENPYSSNKKLLSYNIINNAMNGTNGTTYSPTPITTPGKDASGALYTGYTDPTSFFYPDNSWMISSDFQSMWIVYGSTVTMDKDGLFKIIDPQVGQAISCVPDATCMIDKYIISDYAYRPGVSSWGGSGWIYDDEATARKHMDDKNYYAYKIGSESATSYGFGEVTKTSENTESVLSITTDDYGTSYYYRGGVTDNYVNFAGMCWRIVRIEGDGSTKLILEDQSTTCNSSTFTGNWSDGNTYVFGSLEASYFVGGNLATAFKTFQTSKLVTDTVDYTSKLKIEKWCFDDTVTETSSWGYDDNYDIVYTESEATKGWYTDEYHGAYTRIITNKKPSLNCTGTKLTKYGDGTTDMYVATLTADEISFAGGKYGTSNQNYYLMNDYTKNKSNGYYSWWALSPLESYGENDGGDEAFKLKFNGELYSNGLYTSEDILYARPAVTLLSSAVITNGDGTKNNPYEIG